MKIVFNKIKSLQCKGNIELGNTDARFILETEEIENEEEIFNNLRESGYGNKELENLESQNRKLIEALRESVQLLEDGCLMYDQHVPSGSSSFRSDAQWFIDTTKAVLKEVEQ